MSRCQFSFYDWELDFRGCGRLRGLGSGLIVEFVGFAVTGGDLQWAWGGFVILLEWVAKGNFCESRAAIMSLTDCLRLW